MLKRLLSELGKSTTCEDKLDAINQVKHLICEESQWQVKVSDASDFENLSKIVGYFVEPGLVKDLSSCEDRECDENDFPSTAECAVNSFVCLKHLISKVAIENDKVEFPYSMLTPLLILCATYAEEHIWSNSEAVSLSKEILDKLLVMTKKHDIQSLLCQKNGCSSTSLFKHILISIRPNLSKDTWTQNPSTSQIFKWFLFRVKHPNLSDYLSDILPPSLMFIDHHATKNKVLGINCLHHIIDNVPPTELKMYGRSDVVYQALFHLVYVREVEIVRILYPCLLKVLSDVTKCHIQPNQPRLWDRHDDIYHQLLWNMELEDNIAVRREFSWLVGLYIEKMGITIARHLKRTKKVLLNYLSIFDGDEETSRINALKSLNALIKVAWPRMAHHCEDIMKTVLFLAYDIETGAASSDPQVKETMLDLCKETLLLLRASCPETFEALSSQTLSDIDEKIPGLEFLQTVCQSDS